MSRTAGSRPPRRPPYRRRRWRLFAPTGAMLSVLAPIVVHVMRLDGPPADTGHRTFYVSPDGDDRHDGRSPARAWRSLDRTEKVGLRPGDRLRLRGGARFAGAIRLGPGEAGDAADPVVVDSYGTGRATIATSGESGITVYDTAGVDIRNLRLDGDFRSYRDASGIKLYSDRSGGRRLDHVHISAVEVTGFQNGVEIGSRGATGFRDVAVRDSVLHDNRDAGLASYGPPFDRERPRYAHENVSVRNVEAHHNLGDPDDDRRDTGNGIVLGSVRGGLVDGSTAYGNGARCEARLGPIGIWAYNSTRVVIQHNVSYRNRTGGVADGGGFGLDINTSSSKLQYNLSFSNDGAGYLVNGVRPNPTRDNVVRFNISHDDARNNPYYAGIQLHTAVSDTRVYHNTVVIGPNRPMRPSALRLAGTQSGNTVRNNIFAAADTRLLLADTDYSTAEVLLQGNDLFDAAGAWDVKWGPVGYHSMSRWRSATGQERAGSRDTGRSVDPRFVRPGAATGGALPDGAARAGAFRLSDGSAVARGALDLPAKFGVDPGPADYFGDPVTGAVGAVQKVGR